jgi:hypothetical protein
LLDAFHPKISDVSELNEIYLVMEFIPYDLADLLANPESQMKEEQVVTLMYNLLLCI